MYPEQNNPTAWAVLEKHVTPEPNSGCWLWMSTIARGYGSVKYKKKTWRAHRLSWTLEHGKIPDGLLACHKCDNPTCVNPDHLFLGTAYDNHHDSKNKGRRPLYTAKLFASANPAAKLTHEAVEDIRTSSLKWRELAAKYGVNIATIGRVKNGTHWGKR